MAPWHTLCDEIKMNISVQPGHDAFGSRNRKILLFFFVLAILLHFILFFFRLDWIPSTSPPSRMEVQEIDPRKLETIRQQWKTKQKQLLLHPNTPKSENNEASPDARYFSDRTTRVEKEQKASKTNVLPKPGGQKESQSALQKKSRHKPSKPQTNTLPSLKNLAVPFHLDGKGKPPPHSPEMAKYTEKVQSAERGGDQSIDDPNLPIGSENLLNTQESIYYSFYARLYEAVAPIWQSRTNEVFYHRQVNPGEYVTVVDVILDQEGNLMGIHKIQSSGIPAFDDAVDDSWKKIRQFPNPPQGLLDGERNVHTQWKFVVRVGQGLNFNYLPPQRSDLYP